MQSVFLGSFLFGLLMVGASVLLGFAHLALPGGHGGGDVGHAGHGGGANGHGHAAHGHGDGNHGSLPLWNVSTLLAFLMWFGAAGYLSMRYLGWPALPALGPALVAGAAGGWVVAMFLRLVLRGETEMNPADYRLEGTLARVSVSIPAGGTGEVIFTKEGRRRSEGARGIDGQPIGRDEDVVVLEYERGLAVVQRWEDFKRDGHSAVVQDGMPR